MTRNEVMHRFIDNMERERMRLDWSQAQMARYLELSLSGYKKIISGERNRIDIYIAYKMYHLSGKMLFEMLGEGKTDIAFDAMKKIKTLSESQLRFVCQIIDFEIDFTGKEEAVDDYISVLVPTGNMEDGMIYDSSHVIKINAASYRKRYGSKLSCGIQITSNHLHPVYTEGDILLVCRQAIRDGDTGIFLDKKTGCAYIRKFHQRHICVLEPINGCGETFFMDPHDINDMQRWIKFGYVLSKMRI